MPDKNPPQKEDLTPEQAALMAVMEQLQNAVQYSDQEQIAELQAKFWGELEAYASREPDPILEIYSRAEEQEWAGNWAAAESIYRGAIQFSLDSQDAIHLSRSYTKLALLLDLLDRPNEALEAIKVSIEVAPPENFPLRITTLPTLFSLALKNRDFMTAKSCLDDLEALLDGSEDLSLALQILRRVSWMLAQDETEGAVALIERAREIAEPNSKIPGLAGPHAAMAIYWSLNSELYKREGDLRNAGAAMWECVKFRRLISRMPQLNGPYKFANLATALRDFSRLCTEAGYLDEAKKTKTDSDEIRRMIHLPPLED